MTEQPTGGDVVPDVDAHRSAWRGKVGGMFLV